MVSLHRDKTNTFLPRPNANQTQPHADSATFSPTLSKSAAYAQLIDSLTHLVADTRFWPTNLANAASLLWHLYHSLSAPSSSVNWAGFYVASPQNTDDTLLLGPFMGKVACQVIQVGKGVCGAAAARKETVLVDDVEEFPGHIACDGESRSEIVVPIVSEGGKVSSERTWSFISRYLGGHDELTYFLCSN